MLCCSCGMYFSAARFLGEAPGQHELGLKDRSSSFNPAIEGRRQIADQGCPSRFWTSMTTWPVFRSNQCRLRSSVTSPRWTMRFPDRSSGVGFAAFFPPKPEQGCFVGAHDDPGVGAADEMPTIDGEGFH